MRFGAAGQRLQESRSPESVLVEVDAEAFRVDERKSKFPAGSGDCGTPSINISRFKGESSLTDFTDCARSSSVKAGASLCSPFPFSFSAAAGRSVDGGLGASERVDFIEFADHR